ncbi:hypothetical protein ACVMFA_007402 [Bradyrhizobium liaoningense]
MAGPTCCSSDWGLVHRSARKSQRITFAGAIEHHLERALWKVRSIDPKGIKPDTDAKMISDLIAMLEKFATGLTIGDERKLLEGWCAAARSGFVIRHNIAHGVPVNLGEALGYLRNTRWHGEIRKRGFGDFWAEENTLDLVREAMAVLLRIVVQLSKEDVSLKEIASPLALKALGTARSVLGEFASQDYNPSFEKY